MTEALFSISIGKSGRITISIIDIHMQERKREKKEKRKIYPTLFFVAPISLYLFSIYSLKGTLPP